MTVSFVLDEPGDEPVVLVIHNLDGPMLASAPVEDGRAEVTVTVPTTTGASLVSFGGGPQYSASIFPVALHLDDGDGVLETGEPIIGQDVVIYYIFDDGTDPSGLEALGIGFGWSIDLSRDFTDVPLMVNAPGEALTLSGTVAEPTRVVALPESEIESPTFANEPFLDEALSADWKLSITGKPPEEYPITEDFWPADAMTGFLTTYRDLDDSGSFTAGDELGERLYQCDMSIEVHFGFLTPSDDIVFALLSSEGRSGWSVLTRTTFYEGRLKAEGTELSGITVGPCP
ncbi:MAG: hypothetical protein AAGA48_04405 [Myxococcota bacterium]